MPTHAPTTNGPAPPPRRSPGRPARSEEERAAHRRRLEDAAIDAIRAKGPELAIADIAACAGVSKPVFYDEFGDKLGLADAIALRMSKRVERRVLAELAAVTTIDITSSVRAFVDSLITIIDGDPEVYHFIVRSMRTNDRGLLDNALVRVVHERAVLLIGAGLPGADQPELHVLTDGLFGFVLGAVESWQAEKVPDKDRLVSVLSAVIQAGMAAATAPG